MDGGLNFFSCLRGAEVYSGANTRIGLHCCCPNGKEMHEQQILTRHTESGYHTTAYLWILVDTNSKANHFYFWILQTLRKIILELSYRWKVLDSLIVDDENYSLLLLLDSSFLSDYSSSGTCSSRVGAPSAAKAACACASISMLPAPVSSMAADACGGDGGGAGETLTSIAQKGLMRAIAPLRARRPRAPPNAFTLFLPPAMSR